MIQIGKCTEISQYGLFTRRDNIAVDHILTNFFTDVFKTVISKSDVYDHFSIGVMILSSTKQTNNTKNTFMCRKAFDTESIELFKQKLYKTS